MSAIELIPANRYPHEFRPGEHTCFHCRRSRFDILNEPMELLRLACLVRISVAQVTTQWTHGTGMPSMPVPASPDTVTGATHVELPQVELPPPPLPPSRPPPKPPALKQADGWPDGVLEDLLK